MKSRLMNAYSVLMLGLFSFLNVDATSVVSQVKTGPSMVTRAVRPILKTIHGVTDDLRWLLCLFAIGEFFVYKSNYDISHSIWLRLCLAAFVTHYASKAILDELPA